MNTNTQQTILDHYESIAHVSQLMLQAAWRSDWDTLVDAEACCAAIIERLKSAGDPELVLDDEGRKRKHEIIRRVLADDAQIRDLTVPWMRQLAANLDHAKTSRTLEAAYRP